MIPSLAGHLLVAAPSLTDPNFDRTVVLMLRHDDDGALGVVLTRPSHYVLGDAVSAWQELIAPPEVAFSGGPVSPMVVIALGQVTAQAPIDLTTPSPADDSEPVGLAGITTVDLTDAPPDWVERVRVFSGYSGWSAGQLEGEIVSGSWLVVPAVVDDLFMADPSRLWAHALTRSGGEPPDIGGPSLQPWLN